ncbi:hypothetical protein F5Y14DRAFT_349874 [Nemania sp. NC0429]|nr:hypothetical protein F5Y14DRAFT_349874 [Nemania sp. NC0429]
MKALCIWILFIFPYVWGNTEKTVFLGPPPVDLDSAYPTLRHSRLASLNPEEFTIRTHLRSKFPSNGLMQGEPSWLLLHRLTQGQRYEVRVCWAATEPTMFGLEVHELDTVFRSPELASELSSFASTLHANMDNTVAMSSRASELGMEESILLLRITAAADFYAQNQTLMINVPSTFVDIILDPFILNILPQSLLFTVTYIIMVTIVSCLVGGWISSWICHIAAESTKHKYQ